MKLVCVIQVYKSMFPIKSCLNSINNLYTVSHKSSPIHYGLWWGGGLFKRNLKFCTKNNEISVRHSGIQKHVSDKKMLK